MKACVWAVVAAAVVSSAGLTWFVSGPVAAQVKATGPRTGWEYKVVVGEPAKLEEALSKLGESGWELTHMSGGTPYVSDSQATAPNAAGVRTINTVRFTPQLDYLRRPR